MIDERREKRVAASNGRLTSDISPDPLRVAMVVPPWYELPPAGYGGVEMIASDLVDTLVNRGHDVTLFGAGTHNGTRARFVSTTPQALHRRMGESMVDVLHAAKAYRALATGQFDVVHDHTMAGPLAAPWLDKPVVATVHGVVTGELGDYFEAIGDRVRLVAISDSQRLTRPELPWVATVHNGIKVADWGERQRAVAGTRPTGPVMWLARFAPDKGPDLAIEACRAARLPLVLAGKCNEPTEEDYFDKVIRGMVDDSVEVLVNASRTLVMRRLRQARCLILPIRWEEPFGMVMLEAMSFGVPVVALRRGSVPELVEDGVTGFIRDEPEDLPEALHLVTRLDPVACVLRVRDRFSAEILAARYEQVYRDAIAAR